MSDKGDLLRMLKRWIIVSLVLVLIVGGLSASIVDAGSAQAGGESWQKPVNLSHSGIASNPDIFIDGSGDMVGYWPETNLARTGLASATSGTVVWDGNQWSAPVLTELPFAARPHTLLPGSGSTVRAFWTDVIGDLLFQAATTAALSSLSGWGSPSTLGRSVIAYAVKEDSLGRLHLAYISASDNPADTPGVFFRLSTNGGQSWTSPRLIYRSDYFRQFSPANGPSVQAGQGQVITPSIDLTVSELPEEPRTIVTWDNPGLKRIYLASSDTPSIDSWSAPLQVAKPMLQDPYTTPAQPKVYSLGDQILLLAKDLRSGGSCSIFMQDSQDAGATWAPIQTPSVLSAFCPDDLVYLGSQDGVHIFAFSSSQDQLVLMAYRNGEWSQPQFQLDLGSFPNPDTYSSVQLGCPSVNLHDGTLFLLACDLAGGGDVWYTHRLLGDPSHWFSSPQSWQAMGSKSIGPNPINSFDLVSDSSGGIHAVAPLSERLANGSLSSTIDYFGTELGEVVGPFPILTKIEGKAEQATLAVSGGDQLTMVWRSGLDGNLSFSSTQAQKGSSSGGWIKASPISGTSEIGSDPSLASEKDALAAAYVIPFNERRGVYVANWDADAQAWTDPIQVFDGVAGDCPRVASPTIDFGSDHTLHLVWLCSSLPGGEGAFKVLYANSSDGGLNWDGPIQTWNVNASWVTMAALGNGSVHVFWGQVGGNGLTTWHAMSHDGGLTWSDPINFAFHPGPIGPPGKVVVAGSSSLFFLQPIQTKANPPKLNVWYWSGKGWLRMPDLEIQAGELSQVEGWGAAMTPDKELVAGYVIGNGQPTSSDSFDQQIVFSQLQGNLPQVTTLEPSETPTLVPATAATATPSPSPVAGAAESTAVSPASSPEGSVPLSPSTMALAGLLGLLVLGGGIMLWRRSQDGSDV